MNVFGAKNNRLNENDSAVGKSSGGGTGIAGLDIPMGETCDENEQESAAVAKEDNIDAKKVRDHKAPRCDGCLFFICFSVLLIAAAIIIPVVVKRNVKCCADGRTIVIKVNVTAPPAPTFPPAPASPKASVVEQIKALVGDKIYEEGTAYKMAFDWITVEDPLQLDKNSPNLAQRYLLALLAFTNDAYNWTNCGAVQNASDIVCNATYYDYQNKTDRAELSSRWLSSADECNWFGIQCLLGDFVNEISLAENNLVGPLVPELSKLLNLQYIALYLNQISGTIPSEYGSMPFLNDLELQVNELSGSIPEEFYNLTLLERLSIGENSLSGTVSKGFGKLTKLVALFIQDNFLTGTLPTEVGQLEELTSTWLSHNNMEGQIPAELGNLLFLETLKLHSNRFTGSLPSEIGQMLSLQRLSVGNNSLTGSLPGELFSLDGLDRLDISHNSFEGSLRNELFSMANLETLDVSHNNFEGTISSKIGEGMGEWLTYMALDNNRLSGEIPSEIQRLQVLESFFIKNNNISGSLPEEFYNLSRLVTFDASGNRLSGTLSPSISKLAELEEFYIHENRFTGVIPTGIATLDRLWGVSLHFNGFMGTVPSEMCGMYDEPFNLWKLSADCAAGPGGPTPAVECSCCTECCNAAEELCEIVPGFPP